MNNMSKEVDKKARHESRKLAIKTLFAYLERGGKVEMKTCFDHIRKEVEEQTKADPFAWELLQKAQENTGKVKVIIKSFASEFTFEKIAPINKSILILGVTEMKHFDTPPIVVINEYIELSKEYGELKSASFINAVLDGFRKSLGKERTGSNG